MLEADVEFMAMVDEHFGWSGVTLPVAKWNSPPHVTAGVISKPYLAAITLRSRANGMWVVDARRSRCLRLMDRSASAIRLLSRQISNFTSKAQIDGIVLRVGAPDGERTGSGLNFKTEAALQLTSGLEVRFVHTNRVRAWVNKLTDDLPELPDFGLPRNRQGFQVNALETALYVAQHWGKRDKFNDGSVGHE